MNLTKTPQHSTVLNFDNMEEEPREFAKFLVARKEELGLDYHELAEKSGLSDSAIRARLNIDRPEVKGLYLTTLIKLCKGLDLPPIEFIDAFTMGRVVLTREQISSAQGRIDRLEAAHVRRAQEAEAALRPRTRPLSEVLDSVSLQSIAQYMKGKGCIVIIPKAE